MAFGAPPSKQEIVRYAARVARQRGLSPSLLVATLHHESIGFDPDVVIGRRKSPSGATGVGQLMPGTARGLGVDPYNWRQNIQGSAEYLQSQLDRFHTPALALSAYNSGPGGSEAAGKVEAFAETQRYVKTVLQLQKQYAALDRGGAPTAAPGSQSLAPGPGAPVVAPTQPDRTPNRIYLSALERSGELSQRVLKEAEAYRPTFTAVSDNKPVDTSVERDHGEAPGPLDVSKWVIFGKGADRKGVRTHQQVLDFDARIAQIYGHPLTVGTGTNHNQFVIGTNRESDHWTGWANDIPATGAALTKLGQSALIAAGVPPKKARTMKGGVYNIGKYQILFNTNEGGNHYNHLHVGLRVKK